MTIPKNISEKVDKEYRELISRYPIRRKVLDKENLLYFQNVKNYLIERIKNSRNKLKKAYEWRLQVLAQDFSDEINLIREVGNYKHLFSYSKPLSSYFPFTEAHKRYKEETEAKMVLPEFERELKDVRKYVKYKTLEEIHFKSFLQIS